MTSNDGLTWTPRSSGTTNDLRALLWDGSKYFAAGQNGTILSSANGQQWQVENSSGPFINALAFSGDTYIAVGGFGIRVSSDGVTWSQPSSAPPSISFEAATWNGEKFIAGGLGFGSTATLYESTDGQVWTISDTAFKWNIESLITACNTTWMVGDNAYIYSNCDNTWLNQYPTSIGSEFFMDVTQVGNRIIAAGFNHTVLVTEQICAGGN